ncbi:MAG: hypothetical protein ABSE89_10085 [Sedimentisphaerales bacterium]
MNDNQNIPAFFQKLILTAHTTHTDTIFPCENTKSWGKLILIVLVLTLGVAPMGISNISTMVFLSDGNTPLALVDPNIPYVYQDIMVGTRLTIIVDSNIAEYWYGGALGVEEEDMLNRGCLYGRGYDGFEYPGSRLPDAGENAAVWSTVSYGYGFELYGGDEPNAADWFILDYNALNIGDCNIAFYDFDVNENEPVHTLIFHHVRTRDFNNNTIVDFHDYAIFASHWLETNCNAPNWCDGTDLDINGSVDVNDLMLFCQYWLERTEY